MTGKSRFVPSKYLYLEKYLIVSTSLNVETTVVDTSRN